MKELSIEQKAKRFDEAIAMAKECITYVPDKTVNEYMFNMFPELAENEDKKTMEWLMTELKNHLFDVSQDYSHKDRITLKRKECLTKAIAWLEKQAEQKKLADKVESKFKVGGWSEEDEVFLELSLENLTDIKEKYGRVYGTVDDCINWLESIKERVQPQPRQEWSEWDYNFIKELCDLLASISKDGYVGKYYTVDLVEKLKSLRPQINVTDEELAQAKKDAYNDALDKIEYHSGEPTFDDGWDAAIWYLKKKNAQTQSQWKPSDKQMKALGVATNISNVPEKEYIELEKLYQDLEKLREE